MKPVAPVTKTRMKPIPYCEREPRWQPDDP
jgi:hypothetical protein